MFNLIASFVAALTVAVALKGLLAWHWLGAGLVGLGIGLGMAIALARYVFGQLDKILRKSQSYLQQNPPRIDLAIGSLQQAKTWYPYQFAVQSQIHAQIGSLYFLQRDFGRAKTYLSKAGFLLTPWLCLCMLAVCYYKKKQHDLMHQTMKKLLRRGRHHPLAYGLYAYLLQQTHNTQDALQVLAEGLRSYPNQAELLELQQALQNGQKMKMRGFGDMWYQLQLERPTATAMHSGQFMPRNMVAGMR